MPYPVTDITGKRFGKLVVIGQLAASKRGIIWCLRCDCGMHTERTTGDLNKAEQHGVFQACSRSCSQTHDIAGNKYGFLTAITPIGKTNRGLEWSFQCDCGMRVVKNGSQVARGQGALHCGCKSFQGGSAFIDMTDKRFGSLVVIDQASSTTRGHAVWNCQCDCGTELAVTGARLRRGKTHCGCLRKYGPHNHSFRGTGDLPRTYWTRLRAGAVARRLDFEISQKQAWEKFQQQNGRCALSGVELSMTGIQSGQMTASLDRIDSSRGYHYDNVQWVHKTINQIKMNLPQSEFITWCRRVNVHTTS